MDGHALREKQVAPEARAKVPTEVVGLLPAGGEARRIAPLPCSKEIFPVGFWEGGHPLAERPKAVCHYLLERMHSAGVRKVYVILRAGKWDIPAYLGDGHPLGMQLAYLLMRHPYGPPFTLDQAYPFVRESLVVTGFPDLLFEPADAFARLLEKQAATGADIVLGLFPAHRPHKMDMVALDTRGRVQEIVIKPARTQLRYTWIIAAWAPPFTQFLHAQVKQALESMSGQADEPPREWHVGDIVRAALRAGLEVESVLFPGGSCLDIGTPEDLQVAVRHGGDLSHLSVADES